MVHVVNEFLCVGHHKHFRLLLASYAALDHLVRLQAVVAGEVAFVKLYAVA